MKMCCCLKISLISINVFRKSTGYELKIVCKRKDSYILISDDGWVDDDFAVITTAFHAFTDYAWTVNLSINDIEGLE